MIKVLSGGKEAGFLDYLKEEREFVFNYTNDNPISLRMPYQIKSYISKYYIHPIFDMNLPEGYLFSLLKNLLIKEYGEINDYILFKHLSKSIEGYLTYENHNNNSSNNFLNLSEIIHSTDENLFYKLIEQFLNRSAVSGIQPKVLATLYDKVGISSKDYIIKTYSDEYPNLAENEYFCMKALNYAGIKTPNYWISDNKKLFISERFNLNKSNNFFYGFEEFCVLFDLNKEHKYTGSYEQIAKAIYKISTQAENDLSQFYKMIVMNYLLKNGDAHMKNFGILYTADKHKRFLAPAYDVVNTVVYNSHDKPALTLNGKKSWLRKKDLIRFGIQYSMLTEKHSEHFFDECTEAVNKIKKEIFHYISENTSFKKIGEKMINTIEFSLSENLENSYKEVPDGIL